MASPPFSHFLHSMKKQAGQAGLIVVGNQGADLDSIVSALVLAWHLAERHPQKGPVALLAIPRHDLKLRPEALFVLEQAGIDQEDLLFSDDIDLGAMLGRGAELVLVDHNSLRKTSPPQQLKVTAILDHHHDEGCFPGAEPRIIDPVGSTATLVAELIFRKKAAMDKDAALLLLSAILIDTVNLSDKAGRCTERDKEMAAWLLSLSHRARDAFYNDLLQAQHDLGCLSSLELLSRDYKEWSSPMGCYGMSTVLISLDNWQQREAELASVLARFALKNNLQILIVMLASQQGDFRRELILFCRDKELQLIVESFFDTEKLQAVALGETERVAGGVVRMYRQENVAMSRKKLQPLVHSFVTGLGSSIKQGEAY